ncbi:FHA domain-containing protein [Geothrix sp. PMB-07]|uniref:FHA domain-containing protein n=1 Tax=Geothrix sp. PMB-07 TaxID=3068640 RepID=UPI002741F3DF|nr:FHA domain-containing protein [Geothrix sp. PMB-07]WLT32230.1 FHA domain-containing protein [Geothrix sp. PMB-07]
MAKLLVHESAGAREFEIIDNEVHMGRELDNTLRLPDPSISRHHCVIRKVGGGFEIQDLQSSNGVLVNGNRVQSSPLRDGDRITLGQVQLTFQDPRPEAGATVALNIQDAPAVPIGTVRMSADDLAAIHVGNAPTPMEPKNPDQIATGPVAIPTPPQAPPLPPVAPPVTPAPAPRPTPAVTPQQSFLGSLLPSIPDEAVILSERGDLGSRLVAVLIDVVPAVVISIAFMVLSVVPFLGCILLPLNVVAQLAYFWVFVPWTVSKYGASIGKKMMKLRVVPEGDPTGRIGFGPAILRQFGNFFALNLIVLAIKGDERISLSDMIAKSEVLKVDR